MSAPKIGLSLSGGGSRAIAFHLGCLRALHELGVMDKVKVLSTVSGGSVIGALYAEHQGSFADFEARVRSILSHGLVKPSIKKILTTTEGLRAVYCWALLFIVNSFIFLVSRVTWLFSFLMPPARRHEWRVTTMGEPMRRFASRTTILRRVFDEDIFKGKCLSDLCSKGPLLIVNAADLRTGSAFYYSPQSSGSWRFGKLANNDVALAQAVTASAAYPIALPALDEKLAFDKKDGSRRVERVTLTDGGVYDNLGLAPLWPDRHPDVSLNVTDIDSIICCRAGYGLRFDPPSQSFFSRFSSAFTCVHNRAQNAATKRLYDLLGSGHLKNILVPYLGQSDSRLEYPPENLVTREDTHDYPTNFSAMPDEWIEKLSLRGEQLTKALIREHWPGLLEEKESFLPQA